MSKNNFDDIINRSIAIRKKYHELEIQHHGSEWTVEEDALAFLTDAGLVGRNICHNKSAGLKPIANPN